MMKTILRFPSVTEFFAVCWLACVLACAGSAAAAAETAATAKAYKDASVEEFDALRSKPGAVLLDVRTAREFAAGHLAGAVNLDWNAPDFLDRAARLDKSKTYLVNCASGRRSALACDVMTRKAGLTNTINLKGGFSAWHKAGKPVAK